MLQKLWKLPYNRILISAFLLLKRKWLQRKLFLKSIFSLFLFFQFFWYNVDNKIMNKIRIDSGKNISGVLAFFIIVVLSISVAWFSLDTARKIIDGASVSPTFNNVSIKNLK